MCGDRDQFAQRAGRQAGVAVEREHVGDAVGQPQPGRHRHEAVGVAGGDQAQQHLELAALALPADPALLGVAPAARAVQQQEARRRAGVDRIGCVQLRNACERVVEQCVVAGLRGLQRVGPVGQQRELPMRLAIREPMQFESLRQLFVGVDRAKQRGDDDQHAVRRRNARGEVQPRQRLHPRRFRDEAVHQRDHRFRQRPGHQQQGDDRGEAQFVAPRTVQAVDHEREQQRGAECDAAQVGW
jgi:hypothetical protein